MDNWTFPDSEIIIVLISSFIFFRASIYFKLLKPSASYLATVFGLIIYLTGGWQWLLPMIYFFATSSFLSFTGNNLKHKYKLIYEKSSRRDYLQVLANGLGAVTICIFHIFYSNDLNYLLFLSTIAAATADTWATEVGAFSKKKPVLITTFKSVKAGRSGAISLIGILAAVGGSFSIAFLGAILNSSDNITLSVIVIIGICGVLASVVDSFLGATVQAQYFDAEHQRNTERSFNASGVKNALASGYTFINNDAVNLVSSLSAPLIYLLISYFGA